MSRISGLLLFVPVYFIAMLLLYYTVLANYETQSVEEYRLKIAIDYCVDSATEEMLETGDLGMDYADKGKLKIDPKLALDAFVSDFCLNYDITLSPESREMVKNSYIKLFVVCAYDGYYVYQPHKTSPEGDFGLISTPKLPYTYVNGNNYYALNLGLEDSILFNSLNKISKVNSPLPKAETLAAINKRVSDDLNYRIDQLYQNGWTKTLYIPVSMTTISSTNPITSPTVLAFMDDIDITTARRIQAFGIGGARVAQARSVAAYIRNGEKYYSYSDLLPESLFTATNPDGSKTFIENMYSSCEEAAKAGYHHDSLYMN